MRQTTEGKNRNLTNRRAPRRFGKHTVREFLVKAVSAEIRMDALELRAPRSFGSSGAFQSTGELHSSSACLMPHRTWQSARLGDKCAGCPVLAREGDMT